MSDNDTVVVRVRDFTIAPGARYPEDGDGNATEFYEQHVQLKLKRAIKGNKDFIIDLDNTYAYASSFVSELAVRIAKEFDKKWIREHLTILSDDDPFQRIKFWHEFEKDYTE